MVELGVLAPWHGYIIQFKLPTFYIPIRKAKLNYITSQKRVHENIAAARLPPAPLGLPCRRPPVLAPQPARASASQLRPHSARAGRPSSSCARCGARRVAGSKPPLSAPAQGHHTLVVVALLVVAAPAAAAAVLSLQMLLKDEEKRHVAAGSPPPPFAWASRPQRSRLARRSMKTALKPKR